MGYLGMSRCCKELADIRAATDAGRARTSQAKLQPMQDTAAANRRAKAVECNY